jgi:hypothetical protein
MKATFLNTLSKFLIVVLLFLSVTDLFAQKIKITGTVKDEISLAPIRDVNITIHATSEGFVTDNNGKFTLSLEKIPAAVTLSCIGYETVYYDILKASQKPLEMVMRPRVYSLKEVEIPAKKYRYVFRDMDYSVLDYEIMDDNLLLLVFRYQLKRSELIMLTLTGDTVNIATLPELKPRCLYRDFLGHVHYISTLGNAWQFYYDDTLKQSGFLYQTTFDSLRMMAQPFLFTAPGRVYFQEFSPDGFGKRIGYFDEHQNKEYIRIFPGESTRKRYYDDAKFYSRWNTVLDGISPDNPGRISDDDIRANKLFNYQKINAPVVKLGENNLAVFNFTEDMIELMDSTGKVYQKVPISFYKEREENLLASLAYTLVPVSEWKWHGKILVDEYYRNVYAVFEKNGMVQIRKIDLETGNPGRSYDIPLPLPEKIRVYKGDAYFLQRGPGESQKWKLAKVKL